MTSIPPIPANPGPVVGASRLSYQECIATVPSVRDTVQGWIKSVTIGIVSAPIVDGEARETTRELRTSGGVQPMRPRELKIYAEGERAWGWYSLYLLPDIILKADDKVILRGVTYRVMAKMDWSDYGYVRYAVQEGYQE